MDYNSNSGNDNYTLQEYLKYLRVSHGYSQEYVADKLHIIRQTYSHYETGRIIPPVTALTALARLYNIPGEDLMRISASTYQNAIDPTGEAHTPDPLDDIRVDLEVRPRDINSYNLFIENNQRRFSDLKRDEKLCLFYYDAMTANRKKDLMTYMKVIKQNDEESEDK